MVVQVFVYPSLPVPATLQIERKEGGSGDARLIGCPREHAAGGDGCWRTRLRGTGLRTGAGQHERGRESSAGHQNPDGPDDGLRDRRRGENAACEAGGAGTASSGTTCWAVVRNPARRRFVSAVGGRDAPSRNARAVPTRGGHWALTFRA